MPITASTVYTRERILRLQHFTAAGRKFLWIIMAACTLIIIGCWVYLASLSLPLEEIDFYLPYILLLDALLLFLHFGLPYLTVKKSKVLNAELTYTFEENQFQLDGSTAMSTESTTMQYAALHHITRNKTDLYLFRDRRLAYIADLSSLSAEQLALLEHTLKAALPAKKVRW